MHAGAYTGVHNKVCTPEYVSWSGPLVHRTVPSRAFVHLNVFHRRRYTRPAHRAHTRYGPAHVSANLIYFGPDKKLIYRKARQSWETTGFFFLRSRERTGSDASVCPGLVVRIGSRWDPFLATRWNKKIWGKVALEKGRELNAENWGEKRMYFGIFWKWKLMNLALDI